VAGLFGLIGTAVGGVLTMWSARQVADRSDRRTWEERRRQEYRSAVRSFASALLSYRVAEMDYWHARHGGQKDETTAAADVYRTRAATWETFYELDLSTDFSNLVQQARRAFDSVGRIWDLSSQAEVDSCGNQVLEQLAEMITLARNSDPNGSHVHAAAPSPTVG
jgi:hypothetical protein